MSLLKTLFGTKAPSVFSYITHGGNMPGTPESRAAPDALIEAPVDIVPPTNSIAGMPLDQIIMLGGFALATMIIATPGKKSKKRGA